MYTSKNNKRLYCLTKYEKITSKDIRRIELWQSHCGKATVAKPLWQSNWGKATVAKPHK